MELHTVEIKVVNSLPQDARMAYFVNRIIDNDELWSVADNTGWVRKNISGHQVVQLWPYQEFIGEVSGANKQAMVSFEYFRNKVLPVLIQSHIDVEIFPVKDDSGKLLSAIEFQKLLNEEVGNKC